jgi:hydroxymethylglutaryl-CoA reductase (NADPH)
MCTDKKPTVLDIISGRGRRIRAEVLVKKEYLDKYFRTTAKRIAMVNKNKVWEGTALSGGISYNAHFSNIIAALFCATGQDLAHVVNSSLGYCTMEEVNEDLYVTITLSSMMLGSLGGGTRLPKQLEAQNLMLTEVNSQTLTEKHKAHTMAEIMAGAVLCGELSLNAALASNEHVKAHDNFGRSIK